MFLYLILVIVIFSSPKYGSSINSRLTGPKMALNSPQVVAVTSKSALSPFIYKPQYNKVPWIEVMDKVKEKVSWERLNGKYDLYKNQELSMELISIENLEIPVDWEPAVVLLVGLDNLALLAGNERIQNLFQTAKVVTVHDCYEGFYRFQKYGRYNPHTSDWQETLYLLADKLPILKSWNRIALRRSHKQSFSIAGDMWKRNSVEDLVFLTFDLVDSFGEYPIKSVKPVTSSSETSFSQLKSMLCNCGGELAACMADEECRKALECLNKCKGNDQVCSYKCIVSYETPAFERFASCVIQRHNCMGNKATIPVYPAPKEMDVFRGKPLTFEAAEDIFIGHLQQSNALDNSQDLLPWSWKVVCGQNPAYDHFACQHQLFYRNEERPGWLWYDPVFLVTTLSGKQVWRRRHYKVRRGKVPGEFWFSVLDNGVMSSEHWRILDCADDLSWAVFHYAGAASAAGTSYAGSLIVSRDGSWPAQDGEVIRRIERALGKGLISSWEMFEVDNSACAVSSAGAPPLGINFSPLPTENL